MSLDAMIMFSGVVVTLIPFLGFPLKWDNIILAVLGVFIIMLGIIVRRRGIIRRAGMQRSQQMYVESSPRVYDEHEA